MTEQTHSQLGMELVIIRTGMNVLPEKRKELLQTLLSLIGPIGKEKGCLSYKIFCDIEDEHVFNLISEWETRKDLDHHNHSSVMVITFYKTINLRRMKK